MAWWPGAASAQDIVSGIIGAERNGAWYAPGLVGQSFQFDGADDFVDLGKPAQLDLPGDATVELWLRPDEIDQGSYVFGDFDTSGTVAQASISFGWQSGAVGYYHRHTDGTWLNLNSNGSSVLQAGSWHHIAFVRDDTAKTVDLFVDGQPYLSATYAGSIVPASQTGNWTIGSAGDYGADFTDGLVDEVSVYTRALSSAEIAAIHAAGSQGKCSMAACAVRLGSGINPVDFACLSNPVLGQQWSTSIATNGATVATFVGLSVLPGQSQVPGLTGEVLLSLSPPPVFLPPGLGAHSVPIPSSTQFLGGKLTAQGFRMDTDLVMLNALDLILGI